MTTATPAEILATVIDLPEYRAIAFLPFTRHTESDGDGGDFVTWTARVRNVLTGRAGWFVAEGDDLRGASITWDAK